MPTAVTHRLLLGLLLLVGCSKENPSAPPATFSPPPPTPVLPPAPANASPRAPAAATNAAATAKPASQEKKTLPPGAMLVGGQEPNVRILPREERPELLAMVVNPSPGTDSSLVTVIANRQETPPAQASLPKGFAAVADSLVDASGFPLRIRCEVDGAVMALVPGGLAVQGADGTPTAAPRHPIDIDAFYMDIHEVTVEKFQKFREATRGDKSSPPAPPNASSPLQPAVGVNWRDAMQYAKWTGKELPSESEWEKAARGKGGFDFPWGEGRPVWERRREPGQIDDVGSFRTDESIHGVFDLAGNAREWCQDFFAEDAYSQSPPAGSPAARNWKGPRSDKAGRRVVKGSSTGWELWARNGASMSERSPQIGFRCVLRLTAEPAAAKSASTATPSATSSAPMEPASAPQKSGF
ncbi:Serine/threonine-protein kinase pkn1 [Caulifigura coniformis]|uniref:Serine/threonine-protein kinase pkn1 n=1 Tax=Caulifigura coniformis TaxID=2527983 RepID=A0A517SJF0_9PLAN|nr:SUMF1/EgtB/PvdO family nonheme iron enzyme [Caulifigura coniformis]QDT56245.1 Serine/threonine-protein kinase pkn1 [Caulifigura coniformis]